MPLPLDLQDLLRQYDNLEDDWRGQNNQKVLDQIQKWGLNNHQQYYIHSRQFATDMRLFSSKMYTKAQLQTYPAPYPARILRNAIPNIRRRI